MEALAEYFTGEVLPSLDGADFADLETALVESYSAAAIHWNNGHPDPLPYVTMFTDRRSRGEDWKAGRDAVILDDAGGKVVPIQSTYVTAWMMARKGDAIPMPFWQLGPENGFEMRHVAAVEGMVELLAVGHWTGLGDGLLNPGWLHLLAGWWLAEKVGQERNRLEKETGALKLAEVRRYTVGSCEIGMIPKESAGISWAWGGQGVLDSDNRFGIAPDIGVIALPPGATLLRGRDSEKWPFQTLLPLDDSESGKSDTGIPLVMTLAGGQREMMPAATGKLALLIMDGCHRNRGGNGMIETNLRDLTRIINPGRDGKLQASHYNTVLQALHSLAMLRVVLPGDFSSYAVFDCPLPYRTATPSEYDKPIWLGMARGFTSVITQACPSYKGFFVFNLSGCMRLDTKRPALLRQYIRAAAEWNHLRIVQKKGPPTIRMEIERWALMVNTLSAGAIKAMNGSLQQRRKKSEDIKTTREELEELHERGLLILEKAGKSSSRGEIILRCPDDLEEAWQDRKGAAPTRNPRK